MNLDVMSESNQPQKFPYCDSIYMTFWKTQKYRNGKQISSCQGLWVRRKDDYKERKLGHFF